MENPDPLIRRPAGSRRTGRKRCLAIGLVAALFLAWPAKAREASTNEPARVKISGFGFLGNRELLRLLRHFQPNARLPALIDRAFVEDAALILLARADDEGYLRATLDARFRLADGSRPRFLWTNALEVTLPQGFAARAARFKLKPGVRYYYDSLTFAGLTALSEREAESYFVSGNVLLQLRRNRLFSPAALRSSLAALREAYARAGYQNAVVTTNRVILNDATGAVDVEVAIHEGLPSVVHAVTVSVQDDGTQTWPATNTPAPHPPYSQRWQQELVQKLQAAEYVKGFPDATAGVAIQKRQTNAENIQLDVAAEVSRGPRVHLHDVIFRGNRRTKSSVLERRVQLPAGGLLNVVEAEKARQRLARLGVFDSVRLQYVNRTNDERDVIFDFDEAKPISLSVLGGFGSYELLRGGLEFEHRNFLGLAHHLRLRGLQSFKATKADLLYTVPEVFSDNLSLFLQGSGLRREEVSFNREEYGGSLGLQKRFVPSKTDFSLRYDYEFLQALNLESTGPNLPGVAEARAAALVLELTRDTRDHPLLPSRGLKLFGRLEFATAALGGDVDYQRLILGASYHFDLHGGRLLHLGVTHGMSFTLGGTDEELPFNKRFFPGGENSVRGYQEGKASPLDENGNQLGAETYTLANLEFEQLLTKSWSVVTFFDAVGFAKSRSDYPWEEGLCSVGAGLRWRTLIGPVRLEYGYNLNRRVQDPIGTLHFSIGFPF